MGAGASVEDKATLEAEASKPINASDVAENTDGAAVEEVKRLRGLIQRTLETQKKFEAVNKLMRVMDSDADGMISASEFLAFMQEALGNENADVAKAEKSMKFKDGDKNGTLSRSELRTACSGQTAAQVIEWADKIASADPVKRLMNLLDADADGQLNADEFLAFMKEALGNENANVEKAEKSMRFKDGDKNGTISCAELRTACDGVDSAMVSDWCDKIEAARKA